MATSKKKSVVISAATVKQALTPEQAFAAEAELAITTAIQAMTPVPVRYCHERGERVQRARWA
jgi:hypothetical protein